MLPSFLLSEKAFSITYVRIRFHSPRPESFAIYKRNGNNPWIPYQFYSGSCEKTYGLARRGVILRDNEAVAICTDEFSDISPLTGGSVAFSTLEGRPSAFQFEDSPILQDWVTATDIKIVLTRMNTFGDEVFGDPQVLRSYFYAISDLSVGARCQCNGHANECYTYSQGIEDQQICKCEHNTTGSNCQECLPFFNDRPWSRAYETEANECRPCNCNGLSNQCYFDAELYRRTGHGGHCEDCRDNTDGVNCERCLVNHYRRQPENRCRDCQCNEIGSESMQCDGTGQCRCKPGVAGSKCDRCETNYYDFGALGCRQCSCSAAGSLDGESRCDPRTGSCSCKVNVEGQNCDTCKPGFFGLSENNPAGCLPCFCYGHASVCDVSPSFFARTISTDFETGKQRWNAVDRRNTEVAIQYNGILQNVGVSAPGADAVYFNAPARYLGNQRFSYNQHLMFKLKIGEETARASVIDIIIEGSGQQISIPIFAQGNPVPTIINQDYKFRLKDGKQYQWVPTLKPQDFITILANITGIKIRATYNAEGVGFIDDIKLETARRGFEGGVEASWVERCTCPLGYVGQFCESCAPGYKRDPANGGPFSKCVPCQCNNHSDICDVNTGKCICQHNTMGANCERCNNGFYGDARGGSSDDCQACPCPGGGACIQAANKEVVCTDCQDGYGGNRCEYCTDGYFGDPEGRYGDRRQCQTCFCNENIDPNAVGNCNSTTGECRKCIYNTAGFYCEKCLIGYYGEALKLPKGDCESCNCFQNGTRKDIGCDQTTGQCACLPHVIGPRCDSLEIGFWNINSGNGGEPCDCDRIGSTNITCNPYTGQCECKVGVSGRRCDTCQRYHYGFSMEGCTACDCAAEGSLDYQCDEYGNCPCRTNVDGRRCDRCAENKFNISAGCIDCPPCYDLVQERVNIHRGKLRDLSNLINNIEANPGLFNDTEFINHLKTVNKSVNVLLNDARGASTGDGTIGKQLQDLRKALNDVLDKCAKISNSINVATDVSSQSFTDIKQAEEAIDRAETALRAAEDYIDSEGKIALERALEALDKFGKQSQQMTQIAQRATKESTRQMEDAERIELMAKEAQNTSREALRLAQEAFSQPDKTSREIQLLNQDHDNADRLYSQTEVIAERTQILAKEAHDDAISLYSEAQRQVPKVDVDQLINDVDQIKEEAGKIKSEAERLLEQNEQLLKDVAEKQGSAETKLDDGVRLQQRADELLAEVDAARATARNAVDLGEKTLKEANETLATLKGFDELVQESKGKANDALTKIPDIERTIKEAEDTTKEAQNALSGAELDAQEAYRLAQEAQSTAEDASEEASRIRNESNQTKDKAIGLKEEADDLADDVSNADARLKDLETQADEDSSLSKEALENANTAKLTAEEASDKVAKALQTVENIIRILGSLDSANPGELDQLEQDLNNIEKDLNDTNIEQEFTQLNAANEQIKRSARKYSEDYSQLEKDVNNIEDIKNSLPDQCFKSIEIESPAAGGR
ncbi:hypothetical protein LOTGIDRAFT_211656 [Lottia gigantea]|uniref:Laminin subunit gamma-1 n=1 Tax=Lottia gigantea TaxID=225164 RepID=V4BBD0_LOTGI|nr:hypothetical protein LOTGIDRAFT_211656 [Lottia gigantea]ESP04836.1 hypothetical protein LOTGIDRAFT_211656 [Lottia gigantea]